jgi:hypothetical protein
MRPVLILLAAAALAAAGCATNTSPSPFRVQSTPQTVTPAPATPSAPMADHHDDGHDAPRISLAQAKKDFDAGAAVFIDTHAKEMFENQHIKGAVNIPANDIEAGISKLPKGKKIIAYCT